MPGAGICRKWHTSACCSKPDWGSRLQYPCHDPEPHRQSLNRHLPRKKNPRAQQRQTEPWEMEKGKTKHKCQTQDHRHDNNSNNDATTFTCIAMSTDTSYNQQTSLPWTLSSWVAEHGSGTDIACLLWHLTAKLRTKLVVVRDHNAHVSLFTKGFWMADQASQTWAK